MSNLNTYASKPEVLAPGRSKLFGFDLLGIFPAGALTGTPSVTVVAASQTYIGGATVSVADLSLGTPIINTGTFTNDSGRTVLAGQGVQCQVTANAVDGGNYLLEVAASDGTNSDSLFCEIQVRGKLQPHP